MKVSTWQGSDRSATPQTIAEIVAELPEGRGRFIVLSHDEGHDDDEDASFAHMQAAWVDGGFVVEVSDGPQILRCPRRDLTVEEVTEAFCQYLHAGGAFRPPWPAELVTFSVRPPMDARARIHRALAWSLPVAALLTLVSRFNPHVVGLMAALVASAVLLRRRLAPDAVLVVGEDGFALRSSGRERFVGYGEVREISRDDSGVVVALASGEDLVVRLDDVALEQSRISLDRRSGLENILRRALRRYDRQRGAGHLSRLRRGGRTTTDWVTALRAMGNGASADHRMAPVLEEQLLPVVADVKASAVDRAAAAVALGATSDEGRRRLEELSATTGDVRLRIVIERAADDADARGIEEALAALEADIEDKRQARRRAMLSP